MHLLACIDDLFTLTPTLSPGSGPGQALRERGLFKGLRKPEPWGGASFDKLRTNDFLFYLPLSGYNL